MQFLDQQGAQYLWDCVKRLTWSWDQITGTPTIPSNEEILNYVNSKITVTPAFSSGTSLGVIHVGDDNAYTLYMPPINTVLGQYYDIINKLDNGQVIVQTQSMNGRLQARLYDNVAGQQICAWTDGPEWPDGGSIVRISNQNTVGTRIATITIDGAGYDIMAPAAESGSVNWDDIEGKPSTFTPSSHSHSWSEIGSKPSGLVTSVNITGSGNAVTNASFSGGTLTLTKSTISPGTGADGNYYPTSVDLSVSGQTLNISIKGTGMGEIKDSVTLPSSDSGITQTEADGRYIKRTGDTGMTGNYTFNGNINAAAFYENSDERLKHNIRPISHEILYKIGQVKLQTFQFKNDEKNRYGAVAQQIENVGLKQLVSEDASGMKSVNYIDLLILKIAALEEKVNMQEIKISELKRELDHYIYK